MTRRFGRFVRHNTIALLALFLVLGGTSFAAGTLINGSQIKKHSIAKNRLTNSAIKQLKGNRGPRGLQGPRGTTGAQGIQGAQGLPGPKGDPGNTNTFTYKRTANAGDNITIASFGPFTLKGDCTGTTANPTAQWTISTSADHSAFTDYNNSYLSDFSASDGPQPIEYSSTSASPTAPDMEGPYDGTFAALSADLGTYITGSLSTGTYVGGSGNPPCEFYGVVFNAG